MDPRQVNADLIAAADAKRVDARSQDVTVSEAWAVYIEDRRYKGVPRTSTNGESATCKTT